MPVTYGHTPGSVPRHRPPSPRTSSASCVAGSGTSPTPAVPFDLVVVGAGPAGVVAALRAARLGAKTALITRDQFGGMAANEAR